MRLFFLIGAVFLSGCSGTMFSENLPLNDLRLADHGFSKRISYEEWETRSRDMFDRLDLEGDYILQRRDIVGAFSILDLNNDQQLDEKETQYTIEFASLDRDMDGVITPAEFGLLAQQDLLMDHNLNHEISKVEFRKARRAQFRVIDVNEDLMLTQDEHENIPEDFQPLFAFIY